MYTDLRRPDVSDSARCVCACVQYLYKFTELRSLDPAVLYDPLTSIILKGTVPKTQTSIRSVTIMRRKREPFATHSSKVVKYP